MTTSESGYCHCACRDCLEVAVGDGGPSLCGACEDAGCHDGGDEECLADGAYGGDHELEHDGCLEHEEEWGGLRDSGREDFHSDG